MSKEELFGDTDANPQGSGTDSGPRYYSKVVGKALGLLELIGRSPRPCRLNELTQQADLPKSSVFRILYTLETAGYVTRDESGCYRVASEARPWVEATFVKDLLTAAGAPMSALRRRINETVSLSVLFNNHIETVAVLESPHFLRMVNTVGRIVPPHASAMGKVITALQTESRRETLVRSYGLHRFTRHTLVDEEVLASHYELIRRRGWADDAEESTEEGFCFAAPIFAYGEVRAAVSTSIPQSRLPEGEGREELIRQVRETASTISQAF